ncbi:hypothetical protein L596_018059 [Steinernema carpocapsae]|uniref:Uncharacterized protein n=1 Tax=Steinernema carpocapsae TaxID=34508 RepID=A0A4U5N3H9_STECR|nr:hypothetical protein L596_018059 [Steinernema carpocapsae]
MPPIHTDWIVEEGRFESGVPKSKKGGFEVGQSDPFCVKTASIEHRILIKSKIKQKETQKTTTASRREWRRKSKVVASGPFKDPLGGGDGRKSKAKKEKTSGGGRGGAGRTSNCLGSRFRRYVWRLLRGAERGQRWLSESLIRGEGDVALG